MEIIKLPPKDYKKELSRIAQALEKGKVVVCSTDTVYGLTCDATKIGAVERLFKIKKRPGGKPIPIFVRDIKMLKRLAFVNRRQEQFLRSRWPGRITVVLRRRNNLPDILFGRERTLGLRIPNYPFLLKLIGNVGRPLTGTSANISGKPASGNIKDILAQFKNREYQPDVIIDAGILPKRRPSKVANLTIWPPKVLRN